MKVVVQRSTSSLVTINGGSCGEIKGDNLLCLIGFGKEDSEDKLKLCLNKILNLRIFSNAEGRFDKSLLDIAGSLYLVPQFTLYADTSKGRRPEFFEALNPKEASDLFDKFVKFATDILPEGKVKSGVFGADMKVSITNDGPVTIIFEI